MIHSSTLATFPRQDDAEAIAVWMNQMLQPIGILVKVKLKANRLQILLEGTQIPDQQQLIPYVLQGLSKLSLKLPQIYVYGRQSGHKTVAWVTSLESISRQYSPMGLETKILSLPRPKAINLVDTTEAIQPSTVRCSEIAEKVLMDRIWMAVSTLSELQYAELELEGSDLLITLESDLKPCFSSLAQQVRQVLSTVEVGPLKLIRFYRRNPITQRALPVQEVLLNSSDFVRLSPLPSMSGPLTQTKQDISVNASPQFPTQIPTQKGDRRIYWQLGRQGWFVIGVSLVIIGIIWRFLVKLSGLPAFSSLLGLLACLVVVGVVGRLTLGPLLPRLRAMRRP